MIATAAAEDRFASLLLCLVIVLVLGRLVAVLFRKIGQPVVIGEILVGIALEAPACSASCRATSTRRCSPSRSVRT